MAVDLPVTSYVDLSVSVVDDFGNPAKFELGTSVWTASDTTLVELRNPTDDGMVATVRVWPIGSTAPVRVSWTCDVDLGQGVKPLPTEAFIDFSLLSGEASSATIVAGTVLPKSGA